MLSQKSGFLVVLIAVGLCSCRPSVEPTGKDAEKPTNLHFSTIVSISKESIAVKDPQEKDRESYVVTSTTSFLDRDMKTKLAWRDFKAGEGVRISYYVEGGKNIATEVRKGSEYYPSFP